MTQPPIIKNLLLDLGGVILDIDVKATLARFYELEFPAELLNYPLNMTTDLFYRYETGRIGTGEFRNEVRRMAGVDVSDEVLDEAWNAMIVGIPKERADLLDRLSKRYSLYMLSVQ